MGTEAPLVVLALDWHLLVAQTQQPGEILSLALTPRAEMQQVQRSPSVRREAPSQLSPCSCHCTYQFSLEQGGTREKGGVGSNAAEVPSVWGEADVHRKYLKTERHALPQRSHPWAGSVISVL